MAPSSSTSSSEYRPFGVFELLVLAVLIVGFLVTPLASPSGRLAVRQPYEFKEHTTLETYARDIPRRSVVTINGQGLRGDLLDEDTFNILLAGGSTAICELLDHKSTLSSQIGVAIAGEHFSYEPRVAAEARSGQHVSGTVRYLESVENFGRPIPDLIVALPGANEVDHYLRTCPWVEDALSGRADGDSLFGPLRSHEIYSNWYNDDGKFLALVRAAYASHEKVTLLTPMLERELQSHLARYRRQLLELEAAARRLDTDLVLVTQPLNYPSENRSRSLAVWAPFLRQYRPRPPQILSIPYRRAKPHAQGYVPSPDLYHQILDRYNAVLLEVAHERGIAAIDLAAEMNECFECFYDQWHFTRTGSRRAAQLLAEQIEERPGR